MYKLSEFPKKVRYTMTEYHLFETLPKRAGKRIGTHAIAEARGEGWDVNFPLKNIAVTMNRLIDKIDANKEPFRLKKETRIPGHPHVEYWLERR
jgi:hypothetical protein